MDYDIPFSFYNNHLLSLLSIIKSLSIIPILNIKFLKIKILLFYFNLIKIKAQIQSIIRYKLEVMEMWLLQRDTISLNSKIINKRIKNHEDIQQRQLNKRWSKKSSSKDQNNKIGQFNTIRQKNSEPIVFNLNNNIEAKKISNSQLKDSHYQNLLDHTTYQSLMIQFMSSYIQQKINQQNDIRINPSNSKNRKNSYSYNQDYQKNFQSTDRKFKQQSPINTDSQITFSGSKITETNENQQSRIVKEQYFLLDQLKKYKIIDKSKTKEQKHRTLHASKHKNSINQLNSQNQSQATDKTDSKIIFQSYRVRSPESKSKYINQYKKQNQQKSSHKNYQSPNKSKCKIKSINLFNQSQIRQNSSLKKQKLINSHFQNKKHKNDNKNKQKYNICKAFVKKNDAVKSKNKQKESHLQKSMWRSMAKSKGSAKTDQNIQYRYQAQMTKNLAHHNKNSLQKSAYKNKSLFRQNICSHDKKQASLQRQNFNQILNKSNFKYEINRTNKLENSQKNSNLYNRKIQRSQKQQIDLAKTYKKQPNKISIQPSLKNKLNEGIKQDSLIQNQKYNSQSMMSKQKIIDDRVNNKSHIQKYQHNYNMKDYDKFIQKSIGNYNSKEQPLIKRQQPEMQTDQQIQKDRKIIKQIKKDLSILIQKVASTSNKLLQQRSLSKAKIDQKRKSTKIVL